MSVVARARSLGTVARWRPRTTIRSATPLLLTPFLACGPGEPVPTRPGLLVGPAETWELGAHVRPPLGVVDAPATHALDRPRVVRMAGEDRISVLHGRAEIRIFGLDGAYVGSVGREGEGPGEFRNVYQYRRLADGGWSVLANGRALVRLTPAGEEVSRTRIERLYESVNVRSAMLGDGRLVALERFDVTSRLGPRQRAEVVRDTVGVVLFDASGRVDAVLDSIGSYPWRVKDDSWNGVPMGPVPSLAAHGSVVAMADGSEYEVRVVDVDAAAQVVLRLEERPPGATAGHLRAWLGEREAFYRSRGMRVSPPAPGWEPEVPARLPAYSALVVDALGCIWARRHGVPAEDGHTWDVLDPRGAFLAQLRTPESFTAWEVGASTMLGVTEDELGVGRIVMRALPARARSRACAVA